MRPSSRTVQWVVLDGDGDAVDALDLSSAMVLDLERLPRFTHRPAVGSGTVKLPAADEPYGICLAIPVAGFGNVYVYADNGGRGFTDDETGAGPHVFALEAAVTRVADVERAEARFRAEGTAPSADYTRRMDDARTFLDDARKSEADVAQCSVLATRALAEALHAGEALVVEHARQRIAKGPPRPGFRFGCNGFGYPHRGELYAERFRDLLNFATLPFYRKTTEPVEGTRSFAAAERILDWAERDGLAVKGHPLIWENLGGLPDWLRGRSFEAICAAHRDYILDVVGRFKGRIDTWDVINEGHDWANDPHHSLEQMVELTRLAADTTREANPDAVRVVNSCCTWSEYAARGECSSGALGRDARPVLHYLRDVLAAGVEFDVVGVQMYYPYRDLFEIDRHLDPFCALGKPVHITELGVSSDVRWRDARHDGIRMPIRRWRGRPWSETEQADWIEAYYTICYAKPAIEAVSWWDFCEPAWYPHGALCRADLSPKEGYLRLQRRIRAWRSSASVTP